MSRSLKTLFLLTDIGFLLYWIVTWGAWIPKEYLYQDYNNPLLVSWNLSFLPLDLLISATGLYSLFLLRRSDQRWRLVALISLVLTFCSGLQAIAFWSFRADFDWSWWVPNLYLMIYPLFYIRAIFSSNDPATLQQTSTTPKSGSSTSVT
ncbi:YvaD family protein [Paenibacillus pabuli]|uniref:YvaD family protein n=1 Tax=Paenibacillus pabuli TaxID=1472 RepID=UPI00083AFE16|nr:YvaD family protein [Paenibacillus pabuli]MEC0126430.1 YvaD family protein [Paenibacillus pabuli]